MIDLLIKFLVSIRRFPPAIKYSLISFSITHKRQSIDLVFFGLFLLKIGQIF